MAEHPFDNGALDIRDEKLAAKPRQPAEIRRHLAEYYAMISHLDTQIGRILGVLRESGMFENTIIVLAGDNGLALGQHGLMGKQNLYDHSLRVPLIMAGPGAPAGERRAALCYLIDIFPTLCDLTGHAVPESVEGRSLLPVLQDPTAKHRQKLRFAYMDLHRSIMDTRYKLIEYAVHGHRRTQLFNRLEDPWELENLADLPEYAELLAVLRQELQQWCGQNGGWIADDIPHSK
jgi:arylsulfatase A-like enzyme